MHTRGLKVNTLLLLKMSKSYVVEERLEIGNDRENQKHHIQSLYL